MASFQQDDDNMSQSQDMSRSQGGDMNFYGQSQGGKSKASKYSLSKTAGKVILKDLAKYKADDLYTGKTKFRQDDFNRQDIEITALDTDKVKPENVHRFVESLVTGKFHAVKKDFDPNKDLSMNTMIDADGDGIVSTQELNDYEMKQQQRIWVNRINKVYNMVLGLLGGMSVMHIIFISAQKDNAGFYTTYSEFSNLICIIT